VSATASIIHGPNIDEFGLFRCVTKTGILKSFPALLIYPTSEYRPSKRWLIEHRAMGPSTKKQRPSPLC